MDTGLPHHGVWVRLGISAVHGIGVFAIRDIPAHTDVFANDDRPLRWVAVADLERLGPAERALYHDFGIRRGDTIGCPANFNLLGPGWYLNEPGPGVPANMRATDDFALVAARNIAAGEELTVRYATFSDPPSS